MARLLLFVLLGNLLFVGTIKAEEPEYYRVDYAGGTLQAQYLRDCQPTCLGGAMLIAEPLIAWVGIPQLAISVSAGIGKVRNRSGILGSFGASLGMLSDSGTMLRPGVDLLIDQNNNFGNGKYTPLFKFHIGHILPLIPIDASFGFSKHLFTISFGFGAGMG